MRFHRLPWESDEDFPPPSPGVSLRKTKQTGEILVKLAEGIPLEVVEAELRELMTPGLPWQSGHVRGRIPAAQESHELLARYTGSPLVVATLTLHPDGYVRMAAIQRLLEMEADEFTYFIALAGLDRVLPIRLLAGRGLLARLPHLPDQHFLPLLHLTPELQNLRWFGGRAVREILREAERRVETVRQHYMSLPNRVQATLARPPFVTDFSQIPIPKLRCEWAIRQLAKDAGVLDRIARDPFPALQRIAVQHAEAAGRQDLLLRLAFARRYSIRSAAQLALTRTGPTNLVGLYLARLPHPAAIRGLAEVGEREQEALFLSFLASPSSRVRQAAIRALSHRWVDVRSEVVPLLFDPSPRVG